MNEANDALYREMAAELRRMLRHAPVGSMSTIHNLFGILNAHRLGALKGCELDYVAGLAGSAPSMGREIGKGRNLAPYVDVKPRFRP